MIMRVLKETAPYKDEVAVQDTMVLMMLEENNGSDDCMRQTKVLVSDHNSLKHCNNLLECSAWLLHSARTGKMCMQYAVLV